MQSNEVGAKLEGPCELIGIVEARGAINELTDILSCKSEHKNRLPECLETVLKFMGDLPVDADIDKEVEDGCALLMNYREAVIKYRAGATCELPIPRFLSKFLITFTYVCEADEPEITYDIDNEMHKYEAKSTKTELVEKLVMLFPD